MAEDPPSSAIPATSPAADETTSAPLDASAAPTAAAAAGAEAAEPSVVPSLLMSPEQAEEELEEHPDLAAMRSLMEETPEEEVAWLREQGNIALKEGQEQGRKGQRKQQRKAYLDAVEKYSRGLTVLAEHPEAEIGAGVAAVLHNNRAQAHLMLGNYGRALADAKESARLDATNPKAPFRAAKACVALGQYSDAIAWADTALALPTAATPEVLKLRADAQAKLDAQQALLHRSAAIRSKAERLARCITERGVKLGRAAYKELSGGRKPWVDEAGMVHWPVVVVYPEVMGSDLIEDVCESDTLRVHVGAMFGPEAPPLEWDGERRYTAESVELFFRTSAVKPFSAAALPRALLEDSAGLTDEDKDAMGGSAGDDGDDAPDWSASGKQEWKAVPLNQPLSRVLTLPNHIVPGVPVFYAVSKKAPFYRTFTSGEWVPP